MNSSYFIGIDIGTQGARVVLVDQKGQIAGESEEAFSLDRQSLQEQSPVEWWTACSRCLKRLINDVKADIDLGAVRAIGVTSTSGTVIPIDEQNEAIHPALMYSDKRSVEEARLCRRVALEAGQEGYTAFNSSSGLPKMIWFVHQYPDAVQKLARWVHAADYIVGKLSGQWGVSDYTNALKSGYDIRNKQWPSYLFKQLPLKERWLPEVLPSGTPVGKISPECAQILGLTSGIQVVTGMTDGCASQFASGAVHPGDWSTTIGTTLVVKGVTKEALEDPEGRLYNHRHPEGWWMPGGASNTGADWVAQEFSQDLVKLNKQANTLVPTGLLAYPLSRQGERFPFIAPEAKGFEPEGLNRAERFTAKLEGVAYIERCAYEVIKKLSGEAVEAVYTAGGGSKSDVWLKIRSNVLNLPIYKMRRVTGAMGAAIVAASKTYFNSIAEAVAALTQIEKKIQPMPDLVKKYEDNYQRFVGLLYKKGYINHEDEYV